MEGKKQKAPGWLYVLLLTSAGSTTAMRCACMTKPASTTSLVMFTPQHLLLNSIAWYVLTLHWSDVSPPYLLLYRRLSSPSVSTSAA